ncbi:DNA topoisomerase IV subunit A [Aureibacillus halotolerans]
MPLEDVLGDRFGRYSKYIIQERALPDARDGLKPVQRRILYAMHHEGNVADKPFRKAAKTVGTVIGNYHPHGDSSVYEAMVRMSQDWKLRFPLVEMHGNNGSVDGDPPAAMRYTEARLSKIASELVKDIDQHTVEFVPNFDDTIEEPVVFPAMFPNLLVNGSTGISAGYATDIPPHHLGEVIDAVIMRIDKDQCTVDDLMTVMKGPDFPTGGTIQGRDGIKKAFETGRGRFVIRSSSEIEELRGGKRQIAISEIPYEVNKATLVRKIDELRLDRKVEGISEVRDESDRNGLRIVIDLKKDADEKGILNYLYKNTDLQVSYSYNMVAINNRTPKLMSLPNVLDAYIGHRRDVITKRTEYQLKKAQEREHVVEGLIKALSILDEVIETIRASLDKRNAKDNLIERFAFTEEQAEAIVSLQLYRLTNTDVTSLEQEAKELAGKIAELEGVLSKESVLFSVMKKELKDMKKRYSDDRKTVIENDIEELEIKLEVMVPQEDVMVTVTKEGYIKRTSVRSFNASNGDGFGMKDGDVLLYQKEIKTTDTLLVFTNRGQFLYFPVHELPDIRWKDPGQHIANLMSVNKEDRVIGAVYIRSFDEESNSFFTFVTKQGMVKRTAVQLYQATRYSKPLVAIQVKGNDEVVSVAKTNGQASVFIATEGGYGLRFAEDEVSTVGLRAAGVKAINLKDDDVVVAGICIPEHTDPHILFVATKRGSVKIMGINEFDITSRAKRGAVMLRELKQSPHRLAGALLVTVENTVAVTTPSTTQLVDIAELKPKDRYNNGTFVLDSAKVGEVINVSIEFKSSRLV